MSANEKFFLVIYCIPLVGLSFVLVRYYLLPIFRNKDQVPVDDINQSSIHLIGKDGSLHTKGAETVVQTYGEAESFDGLSYGEIQNFSAFTAKNAAVRFVVRNKIVPSYLSIYSPEIKQERDVQKSEQAQSGPVSSKKIRLYHSN